MINYSNYTSEKLTKKDYSDYISENLTKGDYSDYIAGNLDKNISYTDYLKDIKSERKNKIKRIFDGL